MPTPQRRTRQGAAASCPATGIVPAAAHRAAIALRCVAAVAATWGFGACSQEVIDMRQPRTDRIAFGQPTVASATVVPFSGAPRGGMSAGRRSACPATRADGSAALPEFTHSALVAVGTSAGATWDFTRYPATENGVPFRELTVDFSKTPAYHTASAPLCYPSDPTETVMLRGLLPAEGWELDADGHRASITLDGSQEIMVSTAVTGSKNSSGQKELVFHRAGTRLEIHVSAADAPAAATWGDITEMRLYTHTAAGSKSALTRCTVDLARQEAAETEPGFKFGFGKDAAYSCRHADKNIAISTANPVKLETTKSTQLQPLLVAPITPGTKDDTHGTAGYVLEIATSTGKAATVTLPLKMTHGDAFEGNTAGYTFDIQLIFGKREIAPIVTLTECGSWESGDSQEILGQKLVAEFAPEQIKIGDYVYDDGTWSDGGVRALYVETLADGSSGGTYERLNISVSQPKPKPVAGKTAIGVIYAGGARNENRTDNTARTELQAQLKELDIRNMEEWHYVSVFAAHTAGEKFRWGYENDKGGTLKACLTKADNYNDKNGLGNTRTAQKFCTDSKKEFADRFPAMNAALNHKYPVKENVVKSGGQVIAVHTPWYLPASGQVWDIMCNLGHSPLLSSAKEQVSTATGTNGNIAWSGQGATASNINAWYKEIAGATLIKLPPGSADDLVGYIWSSTYSTTEKQVPRARRWGFNDTGILRCYNAELSAKVTYGIRPVLVMAIAPEAAKNNPNPNPESTEPAGE